MIVYENSLCIKKYVVCTLLHKVAPLLYLLLLASSLAALAAHHAFVVRHGDAVANHEVADGLLARHLLAHERGPHEALADE